MAARLSFVFSKDFSPANDRVRSLLAGCAHYGRFDRPLFVAGYNELCRSDLNGGSVLELCCGLGELTREMARVFPQAQVIGLDRYPEAGGAIRQASGPGGVSNVRYHCGDALRLQEFADGSFDLIFGQATLHHLAHETEAAGREYARLLKPGGRLIFIYEPFGHNPVWAMIRAYRIARVAMVDESNVFLSQLEQVGQPFATAEVQPFNCLGYPFKGLGRLLGETGIHFIHGCDQSLMRRSAAWARQAANFNVVFTKA